MLLRASLAAAQQLLAQSRRAHLPFALVPALSQYLMQYSLLANFCQLLHLPPCRLKHCQRWMQRTTACSSQQTKTNLAGGCGVGEAVLRPLFYLP